MKLHHIVDGPPLYTNCFLLVGKNGNAAVVDPAAPASEFEEILQQENATLTHILLTHGHHDHIGSIAPLREKYNAKLCVNKADAAQFELDADVFYEDGGSITVDDMVFTTIFTPGHTPGSTCILCGEWLFTGDTLFAQCIGRTDLQGGNLGDMKKSLRKLRDIIPGDPQVFPGHEEFSTMQYERAHNPYLKESWLEGGR